MGGVSGTSDVPGSGSSAAQPAVHGTIQAGSPVQVKKAVLSTDGGRITVDPTGSPVDGLTIDVPKGAYPSISTFTVSYSPVTGHTFGKNLHPASPLITVDNGGVYASDYVRLKIPVNSSSDKFVMAFIYDEANQSLEGLPIIDRDDSSITVASLHFCTIVVSEIPFRDLDAINVVDSGFKPGRDDFEFPNNGSYIAPGGNCVGQSVTMMWYYTEKRQKEQAPALYGLYDNNGRDKTTKIYGDDVLAYRLVSVVHNDIDWSNYDKKLLPITKNASGLTQFYCFKYAIYLTGQPQDVGLFCTGAGHAIVCYRVEGNTLYVADPNYPGVERKILLTGDKLGPYSSGANAEDISANNVYVFDGIYYYADSAAIPVYLVAGRWDQLRAGTIGDGKFPPYVVTFSVNGDNGTTSTFDFDGGKNLDDRTVQVDGSNVTIQLQPVAGSPVSGGLYAYYFIDGQLKNKGHITLKEGHNQIGIEALSKSGNLYPWLGFDWIDLYYEPGATPTPTPKATPQPASPTPLTGGERKHPPRVPHTVTVPPAPSELHKYDEEVWNGQLTGTYYGDGVKHGAFTTTNDKGQVIEEQTYVNGQLTGYDRKYINGKLSQEWYCGEYWDAYFPDGNLYAQTDYLADGTKTEYFYNEDGSLYTYSEYDKNGKRTLIEEYVKGKLVQRSTS